MGYRVLIVIRDEETDAFEVIAFEKEVDLINEALSQIRQQVNGLIPKKCVEEILIQKVK